MGPGRLADDYVHTHTRRVADVMTPDPYTVTEGAPLEDVVRIMEKRRIKRLPVVRGKLVVGIVSRANLLHALASLAPHAPAPAPLGWLNVVVQNGVVELWGTITDERERRALVVAAQNIPGVKGVHDHVVWIEPTSGVVIDAEGEVLAS